MINYSTMAKTDLEKTLSLADVQELTLLSLLIGVYNAGAAITPYS